MRSQIDGRNHRRRFAAINGSGPRHSVRPSFEAMEDRTLLSLDLSVFKSGAAQVGLSLSAALVTLFKNEVPLIGRSFTTVGSSGDFGDELATDFGHMSLPASPSAADIQNALYKAVTGDLGLELAPLGDPSEIFTTPNDVVTTVSSTQATFSMVISGDPIYFQTIDPGLPGVPLTFQSRSSESVNYAWKLALKMGVVQTPSGSQFFIDPTYTAAGENHDIDIVATAALTSAPTAVTLGSLFSGTETDDAAHPSTTKVTYAGQIDTILNNGLISGVGWDMNGYAFVRMNLDLSFSPGGGSAFNPHITTYFDAGTTYDNVNPSSFPLGGATQPVAEFDDVTLDLGSLFNRLLGPIVQRVQQVTEPFEQIVSLLNSKLPVLSDLVAKANQVTGGSADSDVTLAKILDEFVPGSGLDTFVHAVDAINNLSIPGEGTKGIDFGSFDLSDPRVLSPAGNWAPPKIVFSLPDNPLQEIAAIGGTSESFLSQLESIGLQLPILSDPSSLVDVMLGYPTELFSYSLPQVLLTYQYEEDFPVWPVPPVSVQVIGDLQFQAGASFGYDTAGILGELPSPNFADGFFLRDGLTDGNGQPATLHVGLGLSVGPALGIPDIATLSVDGELDGDVWFHLANTNANDEVFGSTLTSENKPFIESGTITAGLRADLDIGSEQVADYFSWLPPPVQNLVYQDYTLFKTPTYKLADFGSGGGGLGLIDGSNEFGTVNNPYPPDLAVLAGGLVRDQQYDANLAALDYSMYLGRPATAAEVSYWEAQLYSGALNNDAIIAGLVSSAEFATKTGGTPKEEVDGIYEALDGRVPSSAEEAYWVSYVNGGGSRVVVASKVASGLEHKIVEVQSDYLGVLSRSASSAEVNYWASGLMNGTDNSQVVAALLGSGEYFLKHTDATDWFNAAYRYTTGDSAGSPLAVSSSTAAALLPAVPTVIPRLTTAMVQNAEYYANLVDDYYGKYLGRAPSGSEESYWSALLLSGGVSDDQMAAALLSGQEAYTRFGGTTKGWVDSLYSLLLGRAPTSAEEATWVQGVGSGSVSRVALASKLSVSTERETVQVRFYYQVILGRAPSSAETSYWVGTIAHGQTIDQAVVALLDSAEYFRNNDDSVSNWFAAAYDVAVLNGSTGTP